jgi:predicted DNA-binding protein with PD1-like motif
MVLRKGGEPIMRRIDHPGPAASERIAAVAGSAVPIRFVLDPGLMVDEAVAAGMKAAGCVGGFVEFHGGRCEPFRYVMPAASADPRYVAWYSETFEPAGPVDVRRACAIVGVRDGKTFLHCHGIWDTSEGQRMGHMLAPATMVAEPIEVTGIGFRDATFEAMPDQETNFTLFEPVRRAGAVASTTGAGGLIAKVRPNEDISLAIEEICLRQGITRANVYGIGSLNGVRFVDGTQVGSHATEVLIREGRVENAGGQVRARLAIDVVDMKGVISSGEILRGDNPVCVTFELVIEAIGG